MNTESIIVVDLSLVDKIDTRQCLYNRTFVGGSFSMSHWLTCLLFHLKVCGSFICSIWLLTTACITDQHHFKEFQYIFNLLCASLLWWLGSLCQHCKPADLSLSVFFPGSELDWDSINYNCMLIRYMLYGKKVNQSMRDIIALRTAHWPLRNTGR